MALFILAVIVFIIADFLIRYLTRRLHEKKVKAEREAALAESFRLDFTREAKTLKRVDVPNPKARILCVDDEEVILGSFRKILVLDGYAVDTVESGKEALGLVQTHNYDFVFTDLKMPEMDGVEVTKAVKHLRPDIDVIIITGYATVETAVETMKHGAMDYVQKPFTEDELLAFVKKSFIRRQDKIQKLLQPRVHITHLPSVENVHANEFSIPGGVFVAPGHLWGGVGADGETKVGIDDFATKLIGPLDEIIPPNLGMVVKRGQPLFSARRGTRRITFRAPLSGKVVNVNTGIAHSPAALERTPYGNNWVCIIDTDNLDAELPELKIGKAAVNFYMEELDRFKNMARKMTRTTQEGSEEDHGDAVYAGELQDFNDRDFEEIVRAFFDK
jgi:CheY-like chemotaxis protein/glycine cleavage system H lipoate-binding protein